MLPQRPINKDNVVVVVAGCRMWTLMVTTHDAYRSGALTRDGISDITMVVNDTVRLSIAMLVT